jgi:serine/threonine-protein kinase HipA
VSERHGEYVVYAALPDGAVVAAADLRLETDRRGRHLRSAIRYRTEWLDHPDGFALNPAHAPLQEEPIDWETREIPAVIDEIVPGSWERAVLARAWQLQGSGGDPQDLHAILAAPRSSFRVGAIEIQPAKAPTPSLDPPLEAASLAQLAADAAELAQQEDPELEALVRLQAGSSVGGARPKVVVRDAEWSYIAKFTRPDDPFDHVRLEHVCLELARRAGINTPRSRIMQAGQLSALLVDRFDVSPERGRYHLVSANALLKDPDSQADPLHPRYDDLVALIQRYSEQPREDLQQLFGQLLLNEAINNVDDHLRNFSFRRTPDGFRLAPAYDLVPSDVRGAYPNLAVGHFPSRPGPDSDKLREVARLFQLTPREATQIAERLRGAFQQLPEILEEAGVSPADYRLVERVVWCPS